MQSQIKQFIPELILAGSFALTYTIWNNKSVKKDKTFEDYPFG